MSSALKPEFFDLKTGGLSKEEKAKAFEALNDVLKTQSAHFLGYQANQDVNHGLHLNHYMSMHVNNIGDPFTNGGFTINSKAMEVAVLDYFARLWHAKTPYSPNDPESYWGYILSMGSTEGNMYGMWQARDYLKGKTLFHEPETVFADAAKNTRVYGATTVPFLYRNVKGKFQVLNSNPEREKNAKKPIAYFSEDTHYSITKICRVLDVPTFYEVGTELYPNDCPLGGEWPQTVPSNANGNGDVDIDKLLILVEFFANKGHPPIINLNYGSTFKGAYDDVETIGNRLVPMLKKYGLDEREVVYAPGKSDIRTGYWLHVDGALGSTYAPYLHMAHQKGSYSGVVPPKFDFALPFVHSIGASGHKWPGVPWPCGIFMTKVKYQIKPPSEPNYIASPDTTFAGSRNGYSPIVLWNFYADMNFDHLQKSIINNLHLAEYAQQKLAELSAELGQKHGKTEEEKKDWLWVARAPASLTIRFRRPVAELVYKYSLSGESLYVDAPGKTVKPIGRPKKEKKEGAPQPKERVQRDYAHIYIMYHSTKERVDALLADLRKPGAFDANKTEKTIKIEVTAEPAGTGDRALLSIKPLKGKVLAAQVEGKDIKSRAAKSASNYRGF